MEQSLEQAPKGAAAAMDDPWGRAMRPDGRFMAQAEANGGIGIASCYGCKKCSNGCPLTFAMDLHPYQVVRYAQLGQVERLKDCRTIWVCSACQTCFTRCPNEVDLPRFMDWLKETVAKEGRTVEQRRTLLFHRQFLKEVARHGRVFEGSLMATYMLKSGGAFGREALANAKLGLEMLIRGRLKLTPSTIKDRRWLKALFKGRKV